MDYHTVHFNNVAGCQKWATRLLLLFLLFSTVVTASSCEYPSEPSAHYFSNAAVSHNGVLKLLTDSLSCGIPEFCMNDSVVVFVLNYDYRPGGGYTPKLYIASIDGSYRFTTMSGFHQIDEVVVGPDSRWGLVTGSQSDGLFHVYRVDFSAGAFVLMPFSGWDISFSPDGMSLVCIERRDTVVNAKNLWKNTVTRYGLDGANGTVLLTGEIGQQLSNPFLLPNGGLVYERSSLSDATVVEIIYQPDGGGEVILGSTLFDAGRHIAVGRTKNVVAYGKDRLTERVHWVNLESGVVSTPLVASGEPVRFLRSDQTLLVGSDALLFVNPSGSSNANVASSLDARLTNVAADSTLFAGLVRSVLYYD